MLLFLFLESNYLFTIEQIKVLMVVGAGRGPLVRASLQVSITSLEAYELQRKKGS
jgi:hypothetical protein